MATKRRKRSRKSSKKWNEKLIAMIITALMAIFGFTYNGANSGLGRSRAGTAKSRKNTAKKTSNKKAGNKKAENKATENKKNDNAKEPVILKGYQAVKVSDGDTMNVQKVENGKFTGEVIKIRMFGIDAPEKTQDYGSQSRQALEKLVKGKTLEIEEKNKDRYGRTVAVVYADGKNVNEEMVKTGNAWWYQEYNKNDTRMQAYQENAQKNKLGIFGKKGYEEPWNYRRDKKTTTKTKR